MDESTVREEARNIALNHPVFPGDTISHRTANECVSRGWARRDSNGCFVPTDTMPVPLSEKGHD